MTEDLDNDCSFGDNECPDTQQEACDHPMNHKNSSPNRMKVTTMTTTTPVEMVWYLHKQEEMEMTMMKIAETQEDVLERHVMGTVTIHSAWHLG